MILSSVVVLSIFTWIIYNKNNEPQNQTNSHNIKITAFSMDKGWENLGGLVLTCRFNITLRNMGLQDVYGLKLIVQMAVNGSRVEVLNRIFGVFDNNGSIMNPLCAGEVREFKGELAYSLHAGGAIDTIGGHPVGASYVAKVMLDDSLLDEHLAS